VFANNIISIRESMKV